jgi:hypothetical protein
MSLATHDARQAGHTAPLVIVDIKSKIVLFAGKENEVAMRRVTFIHFYWRTHTELCIAERRPSRWLRLDRLVNLNAHNMTFPSLIPLKNNPLPPGQYHPMLNCAHTPQTNSLGAIHSLCKNVFRADFHQLRAGLVQLAPIESTEKVLAFISPNY